MYTKEPALYIHIPFCKSKCTYCDFFSLPINDKISDQYIQTLINELHFRIQENQITSFYSVYFGGGTPSLLTIEQLSKLMKEIIPFISKTTEITFECNCDDVSEKYIEKIIQLGVNRISVGIQALNEKILKMVNRRANLETTNKAVSILSEISKKNSNITVSVDLISGLPFSNEQILKESLDIIINKGINHISLYSLTLENNTKLSEQINSKQILYDYQQADDEWIFGRDYLIANGFEEYEISNFQKNEHKSKHNSLYWNELDYIGIGSGAVGCVFNEDGKTGIRYNNIKKIQEYTSQLFIKNQVLQENEYLDENTVLFEYLMIGFRTSKGINSTDFTKRFSKNLLDIIEPNFSDYLKQKKAGIIDDNYFLLPNGMLFLNSFLVDILKKLC